MQRSFYDSALKYMKLRPLVFRRIIVWHRLLFSALEANKTTSLEVKVCCQRPPTVLKFYALPLPHFEREVSVRPTVCYLLFPYVWRDMLVVPVNLTL